MKKTGKIVAAAAAALLISLNISAVDFSMEIDSDVIGINDSTILQIKVSDARRVEPVGLPEVDGLGFGYAGITRSRQWINGNYWSGIILQYRITGLKEGKYRIPPIKFAADGKQYESETLAITVSSKARSRRPGNVFDRFFGDDSADIFGNVGNDVEVSFETDVAKPSIYMGQPVVVRFYIITNADRGIQLRSIENDTDESRFYIKKVSENIEDINYSENDVVFHKKHIQTYVYIPMTPGDYEIAGGKVEYLQQEGFSAVQKTRTFEGKKLTVLPYPAGTPDNVYTGSFKIEFDRNDVRYSGGEAFFDVRLSGTGNFIMPIDWTIVKNGSFQVLSTVKDVDVAIKDGAVSGSYTYTFTVVPEDSDKCSVSDIYINSFDPVSGKYLKIGTGPVLLNVKRESSTDSDDPVHTGSVSKGKILSVILLSSLMILVSAFLFIAFLIYEKRKSSHETSGEEGRISDLRKRVEERLEKGGKNNNSSEYINELKKVLRDGDRDKIIAVIERSISFLADRGMESREIIQIREMLSQSRFGGAPLSNETLSRIIDDIIGYMKRA